MSRSLLAPLALAALAALALASDAAPAGPAATQITIWGAAREGEGLGGATYGGAAGALVTERREVDLAGGEVRLAGVAATLDPASVQLRDLTEPTAAITEQRFVPGAATPTELLARHVGDPVTVVTPRGEVAGVLRAADEQAIVVEVSAGAERRLSILRRDFVQDVRLPAGASHEPSLVVRLAGKRPGRHALELTYRAAGLSWQADYLAVLDEPGRAIDFSAWATVRNGAGATYERAQLTLATGAAPAGVPGAAPRFTVPAPVRLAAGDAVQVELVPARLAARVTPVVTYEAMEDPSSGYTDMAGTDCTEYSSSTGGTAALAIEVPLPAQGALPEGRVRLFRRQGDRIEIVGEEDLRTGAGGARIRLPGDAELTGERKALSCNVDEKARTIHERVTVRIDNRGKAAADVVLREYLWRWAVWKLEAEDRKGTRVAPQTQEYRLRVPAKGSGSVTYSAVYTW